MRFKYTASDRAGKLSEGQLDADGVAEVLQFLATKGLKPVTVTATHERKRGKPLFGGGITTKDKIFLTRYLSLMLRVGTDLFSAINILMNNFQKEAIRSLLQEIREGLERGEPFYVTFARYPNYFSPVFINLVKSGEKSGTLDKVFDNLSVKLEKEETLRSNIKAAMTYPIILFFMAAMIILFLVTFALPRIANVFSTAGISPPGFSRIVFTVGLFLGRNSWLVFGGFFGLVIGSMFFFKSVAGKKILYRILSRTPIVRGVVKKLAVQRFASTFSSLLSAGVPVLDALEITADVVGEQGVATSLREIAREGLAKGLTLGEAFQRQVEFPSVVSNLIAISEKTGHIADILLTLARFYEEEINNDIKKLVTILEPVMLLGIGLIVGMIALAIIVPVYQLVGSFGR
jgi:type II secretory pathway component PulF